MPEPYAVFFFNGNIEALTEDQFNQAVRDGKLCRCGNCLACRAVEYANDNDPAHPLTGVTHERHQ